ncbi:class A sortase [Furfurilactobacillus siliginis]|uniref:Sortase n=1 Tax=Furfurilactobacillus siliginis TaxID=348151 RepID=A0A0R2L2Y0_9LACO|nr:class A sortase [Furfurilactobacillus siliginis]KRN95966.1 Sortase [Furfurilactobacillus siliginis]GEK29156.1 class A sortase [Furfurilactobacillus siliginis]
MSHGKKSGRSKVGQWISGIVIALLLAVSMVLIFNGPITNWLVKSYHPTITRSDVKKNQHAKVSYDFRSVNSLGLQTAAKARMNHKIKAIGLIAIPDIKMNLQIVNGVSDEDLALATGTLKPGQVMGTGNYAIAGHRMDEKDAMFSPLFWKSRVGQKIYLTDLDHVYEYTTTERKFIQATRVDVVDDVPGKKLVTLITCDATGDKRLMVRGKYVRSYTWKNAPKAALDGFSYKQKVEDLSKAN